jgi:hypothetical protein
MDSAHAEAFHHGVVIGLGRKLACALAATIGALPDRPRWPQQLSRRLGLNKDIASRIWRASKAQDPLATMLTLPGPAPLRQFLRAAETNGVPAEFLAPADRLIDQFETLIRDEFGERACLDGLIASLLPEARSRHTLLHKQSVYRGMAQLKGSSTEVLVNTAVILPSASPEFVDGLWVLGWFGLRRIRPDATVRISTGRIGQITATDPTVTLEGQRIAGPHGIVLGAFCSPTMPRLETIETGGVIHYVLGGSEVGRSTAVDVVMATKTPRCMPRGNAPGQHRLRGPTMEVNSPCRLAIFDVLVAAGLCGPPPQLRLYDTTVYGLADMNDPARDIDRMDACETVQSLGHGGSAIRVAELPRYSELIEYVLHRVGRDLREFDVFRCQSQYPIYGAQFSMAFSAWEAAASAEP